MKSILGSSILLSLLVGLSAQASGFYKLESQDHVIQSFLDQLEDRLPPKLKQAFPQGLIVKFEEMSSHGRYDRGVIQLPTQLIEIISRGEVQSKPSVDAAGHVRTHKTEYREAQASVIHETAHAYDFVNLRPYQERAVIQNCQFVAQDHEAYQPDECELYLQTKTTFSSDPYYLELAGWPLSPQGKGFREKRNVFTPRTADPYEFKNPSEHFAVNFEYYILDPEYSCRKPSLSNFLNAHFQYRPFNTQCAPLTYVNPSSTDVNAVLQTLPVDRIYQIHYLHADRGQEMASRWGHSMFRLIICAPETKMGPDCMKDEYHHLVLSYRAFVGLNGINSWKSLTGEYNTRLFIIPFREVKNSYIAGELRDLVSYPLKLSEPEKKRFLERSIESHWNYSNQYYFLSNNCAVESLNLLRASLLRPELMYKKLIQPTELRDLLFNLGIIDASAISKDQNENAQRGLFFDNYGDRYAKAYSVITGKSETVKSALAHIQSQFQVRQTAYAGRSDNELKKAAAIIILETAALNYLETNFRTSIFEQSIKLSSNALKSTFEKSMELFHLFSAPYEFLSKDTYGIPNASELQDSVTRVQKSWNESRENKTVRSKLFNSLFTEAQKEQLDLTRAFLAQATEGLQKLLVRQ